MDIMQRLQRDMSKVFEQSYSQDKEMDAQARRICQEYHEADSKDQQYIVGQNGTVEVIGNEKAA